MKNNKPKPTKPSLYEANFIDIAKVESPADLCNYLLVYFNHTFEFDAIDWQEQDSKLNVLLKVKTTAIYRLINFTFRDRKTKIQSEIIRICRSVPMLSDASTSEITVLFVV